MTSKNVWLCRVSRIASCVCARACLRKTVHNHTHQGFTFDQLGAALGRLRVDS